MSFPKTTRWLKDPEAHFAANVSYIEKAYGKKAVTTIAADAESRARNNGGRVRANHFTAALHAFVEGRSKK